MEPQCSFEPLLVTWANWEWGHFPDVAALLRSSQRLTLSNVELSRQIAEVSIRSSAAALHTLYGGVHRVQQAWLQSTLAFSGLNFSEAVDSNTRLISHTAESRDDWDPTDVDAALASHAA
jgi:aerobic-type carbon monoxide dehydrogenase small subunit (CoxS/CutS family)